MKTVFVVVRNHFTHHDGTETNLIKAFNSKEKADEFIKIECVIPSENYCFQIVEIEIV
jgi:hypothetical protein